VNFITGAGGFLQAVVFGYGGIRLTLDQLEIKPRGHLPNEATKLVFHGLKYQGTEIDLTIDKEMYEIFIRTQYGDGSTSLVYEHGTNRGSLKVNDRLSFPADSRLIIRRSEALCP
jgi:trehalose/maltose hydrolase-like predicted phosphorylase